MSQTKTRDDIHINSWRKLVFERDYYTCQICFVNKKLNAHHLDSYNWSEMTRYDINNGITLCENCHNKFHKKYEHGNNTREQFIEFQKENSKQQFLF